MIPVLKPSYTQAEADAVAAVLRSGWSGRRVPMKEIALASGEIALLDDEDYEYLSGFKWRAKRTRGKVVYAQCHMDYKEDGKRVSKGYKMHQLLLIGSGYPEIDHIDQNGLNKQKYNLRGCTRNQNMRNIAWPTSPSTGYIGVTKRGNRFDATINVNGRSFRLGRYATAKEEAVARDEVAKKVHAEFARLNFPERP